MPQPSDVQFFESASQLRAWLEKHHASADELWVGCYSKRSGKASVSGIEIVEQSLCFGWVDSVRYPWGEGAFAQRITPRRSRSIWSNVNIARYRDLERRGLVHASGRTVFERRDPARSGVYSFENRDRGLDPAQVAKFKRHRVAWAFFEAQPPWYRRTAAYWVISAKRDETRARRLGALIDCSQRGEWIPSLRRPSPRSPSPAS